MLSIFFSNAPRIRGHAPNKWRYRCSNSSYDRSCLLASLLYQISMSTVVNLLPSRRVPTPSSFSGYGLPLLCGAYRSLFSSQPKCYCSNHFSHSRHFHHNRPSHCRIRGVKANDTSYNISLLRNFSTIHSVNYFFSRTRGPPFLLSSGKPSFSSARFYVDGWYTRDHRNDSEQMYTVGLRQSYHVESANDHQINEENSTNESKTSSNQTTTSGINRHCITCTCYDTQNITTQQKRHGQQQRQQPQPKPTPKSNQPQTNHQHSPEQLNSCQLPIPLIAPNTPLPPPLPQPTYSFYQRVLPKTLTSFTSLEGKTRFAQALQSKQAESYFPLSQQFLTQMDPAYCGISTLVLVLNALAMDPNVRWRGGWRWYGDESMLLERCCLEEERVRREGITLEEFGGLARCQGVNLVVKRPFGSDGSGVNLNNEGMVGMTTKQSGLYGIDEFRRDIIISVQMPPRTGWDGDEDGDDNAVSNIPSLEHLRTDDDGGMANKVAHGGGGYFLVTSFARHALHQTGDGHFSPIAAYHASTDSCLILDVARFKYTPYWVSVKDLYDAMIPVDSATGKSRGWVLMFPPTEKRPSRRMEGDDPTRSIEDREGKRPAACVPLTGSGVPICPVEGIKVEFCSVRHHSTDH